MFHCNGWCFTWAISAYAGTHVCLRRVEAGPIFQAIAEHKVTHFCGAPIVLNLLNNARADERIAFDHQVEVMTAAAPPPAAVIARMEQAGFRVTHVYGLTEVYGPVTVCDWHDEWNALPLDEQAALKARQGVPYATLDGLMVADSKTLEPVPPDGRDHGRGLHARQHGDEGLSPQSAGDGGGLLRRLVPHRRPRCRPRRRLHSAQGPRQGHHHLGRREHFHHRGRRRALSPPGGAGGSRGRPPRRDLGRDSLRLRHAEGWRRDRRGRVDRLLPRRARPLQVPKVRGVRGAAQDLDRQGPQVRSQGAPPPRSNAESYDPSGHPPPPVPLRPQGQRGNAGVAACYSLSSPRGGEG